MLTIDVTRVGVLLCICLMVVGCRLNASEDVHVAQQDMREIWRGFEAEKDRLPVQRIGWREALVLLHEGNLEIESAENTLSEAKDGIAQVYRDLMPLVTMRLGYGLSIDEFDRAFEEDVVKNNLTFNMFVVNLLQGFISLPRRAYSARMQLFGAEIQREKVYREQVLTMYGLFQQARRAEQWLELTGMMLDDRMLHQDDEAAYKETQTSRDQWLSEQKKISEAASAMFNRYDVRWELVEDSLPLDRMLAAGLYSSDLDLSESMQVKAIALDIVASEARVDLQYLQYLPTLDLSLALPTLYRINRGESETADFNEMRVHGGLNYMVDTRGHRKRATRQAEFNRDYVRKQSEAQIKQFVQELSHRQDELAKLDATIRDYEYERQLIRDASELGDLDSVSTLMQAAMRVEMKIAEVERQRLELMLPLLAWDPYWQVFVKGQE
ncbi:hypothetical protein [Poriferisphaera sp. WC338]|uniref:hypothetical protein n=1 Tax=Poriferisphaera sp. WC338 TaxID=3425129 RepID=UPI003D8135BE